MMVNTLEQTGLATDAFRTLVLQLIASRERNSAIQELAKHMLGKYHIYTIRSDQTAEMWIYHAGVYVPNARTYIKEECYRVLRDVYTERMSNEVTDRIEAQTYIDPNEFFSHNHLTLMCVENGILDMETRALRSHDPKVIFFNKLPVRYEPEAECPNIQQFIREVVKDPDHDVDIIQETFGYLLHKEYTIEKALMFTGTGRNGKGKLIDLMKLFIGPENCSNIPLQKFETQFGAGELFGKMANLGADISNQSLKETGMFKSLTGRDLISADRKYLTMIHFTNYAKMIFCANEIPKTRDISPAFFQRWILIEFPNTFLPEPEYRKAIDVGEGARRLRLQNPNIIQSIVSSASLSGLLNWALDGRERLLTQKGFSHSQSMDEVKLAWIRKSDSLRAFIMDRVVEDGDERVAKPEFLKKYSLYCRKYQLQPSGDKRIKEVLGMDLGISDSRESGGGEKMSFWNGIKLKDKEDRVSSGNDRDKEDRVSSGNDRDKEDRVSIGNEGVFDQYTKKDTSQEEGIEESGQGGQAGQGISMTPTFSKPREGVNTMSSLSCLSGPLPQDNLDDLKEALDLLPQENKEYVDNKFSQEYITLALTKGIINENPAGTYRMTK